MVHRLTWLTANRGDQKLSEYLILALMDSGAAAALQDADQNYIFVANLPEVWRLTPDIAPTDVSLFGETIARRLGDVKATLRDPEARGSFEVKLEEDQIFEFRIHAIAGQPELQYLITIRDISRERRRERLLEQLLRDVSHRSKNLLAIIQSIAAQTARYALTLDQFLQQFRGRLYSMAQSQDLVTDSSWRGAYFRDLVRQQTMKYAGDEADAIEIAGTDTLLSPNASLHLGLALHELIVNAVRRGTLTRVRSPIQVICLRFTKAATATEEKSDMIEVTWRETLPQPEAAPQSADGANAFGDVVLERVVPAAVAGSAHYETTGTEIIYRILFPAQG